MNSQEYYLNIRPGEGFSQTVKVSQGDVGRPLLFHLMDGATPLTIAAGSDVVIHATKPSGLGFTEACTVTGSSVSVSSTIDMTQEFGLFPAEIVVSLNDEVLATANFSILVERSPHPAGTTDGVAEDLQDIYEQLDDLKEDIEQLDGLSDDVKAALLQIASKVAYIDDDGQDYYDALYDALYPPAELVSISAVYTQSGTVYDTDTLDSLKADLVVTALYDDQTTATVTAYTLSGTLEVGTSTITVSYGGKTTTFDVTVSQGVVLPLYQLATMTEASSTRAKTTVTDIDHVKVVTSGTTASVYIRSNGTAASSFGSVEWFGLASGDEYEFKVKNIEYSNSNSGNQFAVALKDSGGTTVITTGNQSMSISESGTMSDVTVTGTIASDIANVCLFYYCSKIATVEFDVELYVNGIRYV